MIYKVHDIEKAKEWYSKAFLAAPYFDEPFYVGYTIGGFELGLQPSAPGEHKAESVAAYWGVENVDEEYKRFVDLGAVENEPPQNVGGDVVVATVKDPWNNVIGLIYNPAFKIE